MREKTEDKVCIVCRKAKAARHYANFFRSPTCVECRIKLDNIEHEERKAERRKERELDEGVKAREAENKRKEAKFKENADRTTTRRAIKKTKQANDATKEFANRELCSRKLLPFIMRFHAKYIPGWMHKDICERLEKFSQDVIDGKEPRLMLFTPPRHGKSEIASINFPAWHLGRAPDHDIIATSYAATLTMSFSKKIRGMLRDDAYGVVFPETKLDPENQSAETWMTTKGGTYVAAGVGGGITGKGAHILIIDDPVKNRDEADSDTAQRGTWDWYTSTAYTRLAPGAGVLVIQTRWNESDLSGRLIEQMDLGEGDEWEIVDYPAIALEDEKYRKVGEALHPARYDAKALKRIRRAVGERDWWALFQQQPTAQDGTYFTRNMFKYYDGPAPGRLNIYQAWDLAIGKKEANDWTVGVTVGVDEDDVMYVLDMVRGRWDSMEIIENMLDSYEKWRPLLVGIEEGHIRMAIGPFLDKRIRERKLTSMAIEKLPPGRRDKEARARGIQGRMQQGMVLWPKHAIWLDTAIGELLSFSSGGKHDDIVDAFAWIGLMLSEIVAHRRFKPQKLKSWRDKLKHIGRSRDPMAA